MAAVLGQTTLKTLSFPSAKPAAGSLSREVQLHPYTPSLSYGLFSQFAMYRVALPAVPSPGRAILNRLLTI
jgi:hypothetical protein